MSETINIDFIGTVSLNNAGLLEYNRLPIPKLYDEEMQTLEAMSENDNRTVMDLQDYFQRFMPMGNSEEVYNYCAPNGYSSSFITHAEYPTILSFGEYKEKLKKAEESAISNFLSNCDKKDESQLSAEQRQELDDEISSAKERCKDRLKKKFIIAAVRYIKAFRYYTELRKVKADNNIKMYSTENIGWTTFNYPISDDILFFMKSNFGYGSSSYHYINLSYKGIDILPYSALVKYYYVNMIEFYRYTRQYRPTHDNWEVALDFVVETANLAIQDETAFITKWIGNEIDEMVAGLKIISEQPKKTIREFFAHPNKEDNFLYVRNAFKSDKEEYFAYPEEVSTIFKAEKLSAALELLEKLQVLAPAYPKALEAIEQIKQLNVDFFPNLKLKISAIEREIKRRKVVLKPKVRERDRLKLRGKVHFDKIDKLIEAARKAGKYNFDEIRAEYFTAHPDFKRIYDAVEEKSEQIRKDEHEIDMRENFMKRLVACKELIKERLELAA
jgi:hypothetical protein